MPTVLILDDSSTNQAIYSMLAGSLGTDIKVQAFAEPLVALTWLASNVADLVITDFQMPGFDGAEFTRRLRSTPLAQHVPVIVVTAYSDHEFRVRALQAGATDFLLSPVDHMEFTSRGRNLLALGLHQRSVKQQAETLAVELRTTHQAHQEAMRGSREALALVIDTVPALISATARDGHLVFVNDRLATFVDSSPEELVGRVPTFAVGGHGADAAAAALAGFATGGTAYTREEVVIGPGGEEVTLLTTSAPLHGPDGDIVSVLTSSVDITDRKQGERRLQHLAHHDGLTGLANRTLLRIRLEEAVDACRSGEELAALHFIDLDRFKAINDGIGHHFGDSLLVAVAGRLDGLVRAGDTVARLGGDEFAIVQRGVSGQHEAVALADRVCRSLSEPFGICDETLTITASVGIMLHPRDGESADEMLRTADLAMYAAKASGRGTWCVFEADMSPPAREAMRMESDLRGAIGRSELELHFQPQVNLRSGLITGVEALVRWRRNGSDLVQPGSFINLAEETGLILPLGEWVLHEACRQACAWRADGLPAIRMAVNVSAVQMARQDVHMLVMHTLRQTGLAPEMLELELTESTLIRNHDRTTSMLQKLRDIGVAMSADDFGTGYSSLSYIDKLPLSRLKIDQSFISGMGREDNDVAVVRHILNLGRDLGLDVIAEGVETEQQAAWLRAEGCQEAQGFLFGRPVPASEITAILERSAFGRSAAD